MKAKISLLTTLILALLPIGAKGQGSFVFNGGFDTDASGWTATNIGNTGGYDPGKGNPGGFFFLAATPSPSDPTIAQTISGLTVGLTYLVSGDYAWGDVFGDTSTENSFGVALDGVFLFETARPTSVEWQTFNFFYTAESSSALLSLSGQRNGTSISYGIDNISIVAVPEPSTVWLIAIGGVAFLGVRRFRTE